MHFDPLASFAMSKIVLMCFRQEVSYLKEKDKHVIADLKLFERKCSV